jgi:hypothetical protein
VTLDPIPEVAKPLRPQAAKRRVIEASVTIAKRAPALEQLGWKRQNKDWKGIRWWTR